MCNEKMNEWAKSCEMEGEAGVLGVGFSVLREDTQNIPLHRGFWPLQQTVCPW